MYALLTDFVLFLCGSIYFFITTPPHRPYFFYIMRWNEFQLNWLTLLDLLFFSNLIDTK